MADEDDNNNDVNENNLEPNPITNAVLSIVNNVEAPIDITQMLQNGRENRRRNVEEILNNEEDNAIAVNDDESFNASSISSNSTRRRNIIEPLDDSNLNQKKFTRIKQLTLSDLAADSFAKRKGYLDLQFLRVISNGRSKQQNQVRYYKANDSSKKMNAVGYKRLYLMRVINQEQPTSNLVYIVEDDIHHTNLWKHHISIRDNGGITIGTILRFFIPKPYENIMPDGVPSIESRFPVAIMKTPSLLSPVPINFSILGGESMAFCLNGCMIESLAITPEETGCAGRFCDKQRIVEVMQYNQGCACYSYDSRRTNAVIDHTLNIEHHSLEEKMHVANYSSAKFSLLYQTAVFSSQIRSTALDLTDEYFDLENSVSDAIELINDNGGFTVIGWYKRGNIADRTILYQNKVNSEGKAYAPVTGNDESNQIDNGKITFHPCVIKPSNNAFYDSGKQLHRLLKQKKFDVSKLIHLS